MSNAESPNIVIIMTDQQRADFFRSEGFAWDTMPFVDELGRRGVRFRRAYTPIPVCGPARTSMFTGRFPKATRVRENSALGHVVRPDDLIDVLRSRGYSVNLAGKNHTYRKREDFDFASLYNHRGGGRPERQSELHREFDGWLKRIPFQLSLEPAPYPVEAHLVHRIVDDAIECLRTRDERPFFLWLSIPEPHPPYEAPEPYYSMFSAAEAPARFAGPEGAEAKGGKWRWARRLIEEKYPRYDEVWRRYRAVYCAMIRMVDDEVRRFVSYLEESGNLENTILIFTSDHGDYAGDYGLHRKGVSLPECLVRIPMLFVGPGIEPQEAPSDAFVSLVDIMPTLCEAIGAPVPHGVQGRSLWPLLTGGEYPKEEFRSIYAEVGVGGAPYGEAERPPLHFPYEGRAFDSLNAFTQSGKEKMVRLGDWKLVYDVMGRGELYDLSRDPGELDNLYDDPAYAAVRIKLLEEMLRWTIRAEDDLPAGDYAQKRVERNWYAALE